MRAQLYALRYRLSTAAAVFLLAAITTGILGCSVFGLPVPETFNERLAAGYTSVTGVRNSATALLDSGTLSSVDGLNVLDQTDNARAGLDIARQIHTTNPNAGSEKLTAVVAGLKALNGYLCVRRDGKYNPDTDVCVVGGRP